MYLHDNAFLLKYLLIHEFLYTFNLFIISIVEVLESVIIIWWNGNGPNGGLDLWVFFFIVFKEKNKGKLFFLLMNYYHF